MSNPSAEFSLTRFEYHAYRREHERAGQEFIALLRLLDRHYGQTGPGFQATVQVSLAGLDLDTHLLTRLASAVTALFTDPSTRLSPEGFSQLIHWHRWIGAIFSASPFRNADHILRSMNQLGFDASEMGIEPDRVMSYLMFYSPESEIPMDFDALWAHDKRICAALCFALMSPRFLGSPAAHSKRELLLAWLPAKLSELDSLDFLPGAIVHDVCMHCSYADLPERHSIKAPLNALIRKKLLSLGITDLCAASDPKEKYKANGSKKPLPNPRTKPVMLVAMEWFSRNHSIYRTHSRSLLGCRSFFIVIGVGYDHCVDTEGRAVFDEFHSLDAGQDLFSAVGHVRALAQKHSPNIFYMPSVGMFPLTMVLTNARLAPVQVIGLGHPATTLSDKVDYVSVESDFVGSEKCFSETLLRLPSNGQPYVAVNHEIGKLLPQNGTNNATQLNEEKSASSMTRRPIRIAVAATTMKLNPKFLKACRGIQERAQAAQASVQFVFLVGQAIGLLYPSVKQVIQSYLPTAEVWGHQAYPDYLKKMASCDFFLSPFPFGNTNGIIDAVSIGLTGICKTGPEVFEHIDEGLFRRLGFPDNQIAKTVEDYVNAACSMIHSQHLENTPEAKRARIQALQDTIYSGDQTALGTTLCSKLFTAQG